MLVALERDDRDRTDIFNLSFRISWPKPRASAPSQSTSRPRFSPASSAREMRGMDFDPLGSSLANAGREAQLRSADHNHGTNAGIFTVKSSPKMLARHAELCSAKAASETACGTVASFQIRSSSSLRRRQMQSRIVGTTMPVLEFALEPNESVISEAGELSWMTQFDPDTITRRWRSGGIFWRYQARGGRRNAVYDRISRRRHARRLHSPPNFPVTSSPSKSARHEYMIHRHGFLCAIRKFKSASDSSNRSRWHLRGDGFLLQRLSGLVQRGSNSPANSSSRIFSREKPCASILATSRIPVQRLVPDTTVPGIKNMIFGGDGIFLASLTACRIWLQTLRFRSWRTSSWNTCQDIQRSHQRRRRRRHRRLDSGWDEVRDHMNHEHGPAKP